MSTSDLRRVGTTTDGRPVVAGEPFFVLADSYGFPLSCSLAEVFKRGWRVDWLGYFRAYRDSGRDMTRLVDVVREAFVDAAVWPAEHQETVLQRLRAMVLQHFENATPRDPS